MKKIEKNVYVQPECKVFHVKVDSIIATSITSPSSTETLIEEDFGW